MRNDRSSVLIVSVPNRDARVFRRASQLLAAKIGRRAPKPVELVLHELSCRRPASVAAEYLDFIGSSGSHLLGRRRKRKTGSDRIVTKSIADVARPSDLTRN